MDVSRGAIESGRYRPEEEFGVRSSEFGVEGGKEYSSDATDSPDAIDSIDSIDAIDANDSYGIRSGQPGKL